MKLPVSRRWAFPPITSDPQHLNHYLTFDQFKKASNPDEHLKEIMNSHCEKCRYVFTSENDKDRHLRLIHGGIRSRDELTSDDTPHASEKIKANTCLVCSETFTSRYQLQKHQNGRPKKKL